MEHIKTIATGNRLFLGITDPEAMFRINSNSILNAIADQLNNLCPTSTEAYCIEWKITKGPLTGDSHGTS